MDLLEIVKSCLEVISVLSTLVGKSVLHLNLIYTTILVDIYVGWHLVAHVDELIRKVDTTSAESIMAGICHAQMGSRPLVLLFKQVPNSVLVASSGLEFGLG